MSRGLPRRAFQVFNGGGLDTKTDPRLVPAGELVELENVFMLKTGELRLRNGFAKQTATRAIGSANNLFSTAQGGVSSVARNWLSAAYALPVKYAKATVALPGWEPSSAAAGRPYPAARALISGIEASATGVAADLIDPDGALATDSQLSTWVQDTTATGLRAYTKEPSTGRATQREVGGGFAFPATNGRPPIACAGGSTFLCVFWADNAGTPSLKANVQVAGAWSGGGPTTLVLNGVSAAQPWIDVKPIPGGNLIAVAYRASGGGVSCLVFNPSTRTVTVGPVNTAAADASFALGFLDDSLATGNMYLITAGSAAGVVVRTMLATTMVVSATDVIDATVTVGIRQVTGYINTSATNYVAMWDVAGTSSIYDKVKRGAWTGAAAVADLAPSFSIYSRAFKWTDGAYYFVGAYDSGVQPAYAMLGTSIPSGIGGPTGLCYIMGGEAGGRRTVQCSLSSPFAVGSDVCVMLPRKRRISTPGTAAIQGRVIQQALISDSISTLCNQRELGGTLFMAGGLIHRDDGNTQEIAVFPFYPEAPTGVTSATGSMTPGGAYAWRIVWKRQDATGRISRSAGSVPLALTLAAADGRCTLAIQNPRVPLSDLVNLVGEVYRAGPAAAGATAYNKVGEVYPNAITNVDTVAFVDSMSDVNAALGEQAYFTGNVLEGFAPPSCNLLEVCGNRVGIVNAENPTEFWPSLEYKAGEGIRFNPLLAINVTGDGVGAITALGAMDGRWILFKKSAIYVISGAGPNDLGQGSFSAPQAISRSIGTVLPRSVVATPDGLMFQAAAGIYLLDRGLGLTYVGAPVEQYTLAANVVGSSIVNGVTQVRFVMASGRCLVWDYHHKRWSTFLLRVDASTVVACADSTAGWCYILADGTLMQETPGVYSDVNGTSTAIVPRIGFPALALNGINGFERFCGVDILGEYVGDHTLAVDFEYDYSGGVTETRTLAVTAGPYQYEVLPTVQKCTSVKITLRTSVLAAGSGAFKLSGLTLWAAMKKGSALPFTKRMT